jgi:hypothetical protein
MSPMHLLAQSTFAFGGMADTLAVLLARMRSPAMIRKIAQQPEASPPTPSRGAAARNVVRDLKSKRRCVRNGARRTACCWQPVAFMTADGRSLLALEQFHHAGLLPGRSKLLPNLARPCLCLSCGWQLQPAAKAFECEVARLLPTADRSTYLR